MSRERLTFSEISHPPQFESMAELLEVARRSPAGEPETYGATPLDHQAAYGQQREVLAHLQLLVDTEVPDDVPAEVIEYIKDTFAARFHGRSSANQENYLSSLRKKQEFSDDATLLEAIERAELGQATPAELLIVRQVLGIRSAELACLTHPYGKRIEMLDDMRQSVRQNVELMGGEYYDQPQTRYRAKSLVGGPGPDADCSKGFLMTRKRTLGTMPDGTIIRERSSFVLRSDEASILSQEDLAALNQLDPWAADWQDEAVRVGRLDKAAEALTEMNEFSLAIPISTTIYAYNPETTRAIHERDEREHAERTQAFREELEKNFPALAEAVREGEERRRIELGMTGVMNFGDMLFVNRTGDRRYDPQRDNDR